MYIDKGTFFCWMIIEQAWIQILTIFKCSVNTWSSPLSLADVAWERRGGGAMSIFHGKPFMGVFLASSEEANPV